MNPKAGLMLAPKHMAEIVGSFSGAGYLTQVLMTQGAGDARAFAAEYGGEVDLVVTSGGDGTPDYHPSEETRKKLSEARKKENLSEETLLRRSEGLRGRKFTDEHKKKIGDGNSKQIRMLSKDGVLLKTFRCARDAEEELRISHSHISQCCHGIRRTAGGYQWQFAS